MYNVFNLSNLRDRSYILLVISIALCFSSVQTVLTPSLDYIALNVKNNNHAFYNYALIGSLAATIPQASSLIAGYIVNNLLYKHLVMLICSIITIISGIVFFYNQNFTVYASFVICCGILFNALVCGVDRQIVTLLADKIRDFQNDLMILSALLAMANYKVSNYIFTEFGLHGIIIYCLLLNFIIFMCLRAIPAVDKVTTLQTHIAKFPSIQALIKILLKHSKLITFVGIMYTIMFTSSGIVLLLTTKIHHENLPTSLWSSNMVFMALGGLLGAIICKMRALQHINGILVICIGEVLFGLCLFGMAQTHSATGLVMVLWFLGFLNPFILINMNTITFKYISRDDELIAISPVVNGLLTTIVYLVCLMGPIVLSPLLQLGISYKTLLMACGTMEILLAIVLINIKSLKMEFP